MQDVRHSVSRLKTHTYVPLCQHRRLSQPEFPALLCHKVSQLAMVRCNALKIKISRILPIHSLGVIIGVS